MTPKISQQLPQICFSPFITLPLFIFISWINLLTFIGSYLLTFATCQTMTWQLDYYQLHFCCAMLRQVFSCVSLFLRLTFKTCSSIVCQIKFFKCPRGPSFFNNTFHCHAILHFLRGTTSDSESLTSGFNSAKVKAKMFVRRHVAPS